MTLIGRIGKHGGVSERRKNKCGCDPNDKLQHKKSGKQMNSNLIQFVFRIQ